MYIINNTVTDYPKAESFNSQRPSL